MIYIVMDGGVIQDIMTDTPTSEKVTIIDFDVDESLECKLSIIDDENEAYVSVYDKLPIIENYKIEEKT